ncbi:pyridoxal 5'-phosphate synthase glutaminase subunit PdxT [Bacillus massiliglaciei]|uniref:pyridoxal 5'-phosphate synthase glutaminase subunit PdxT n=1 Tax=Bacillus massiliglaciei TaxID=1816693 RepID=UPI000B01E6BE|nr:pyridoxal 5'-phosphate synthase glutaminase subunit PdxT [Bacillus massiliglaciei]
MLKIGVLSLQGAVTEHMKQIKKLGASPIEIKHAEQLNEIDGLILPGGESTTVRKLMDRYGFMEPIRKFADSEKPIFGTCAGMVLLAKNLSDSEEGHLSLIDITVKRNAFGRQKESFETMLSLKGIKESVPAVFIRAPLVEHASDEVEILAEYEGQIVAAKQGNILVTSFHPELTEDYKLLSFFLDMIKEKELFKVK